MNPGLLLDQWEPSITHPGNQKACQPSLGELFFFFFTSNNSLSLRNVPVVRARMSQKHNFDLFQGAFFSLI